MKAKRSPRRRVSPQWTPLEWDRGTAALMKRCKGRCEICGDWLRGRAHRSHRARRQAGGDRLSNLMLVHPECHERCHHEPEFARSQGWHLFSRDDPSDQPVWYMRRRWVLLDDSGDLIPFDRMDT